MEALIRNLPEVSL